MFFPPKRKAIFSALLALSFVAIATDCLAQTAEFEKRAAAMRRAVSRGQQAQQIVQQSTYVELSDDNSGYETLQPPVPAKKRTGKAKRQSGPAVRTASVRNAKTGVRRQVGAVQVASAQGSGSRSGGIVSGGSATRSGGIVSGGSRSGGIISGGSATRGGYVPQHLRSSQFIDDGTIIDGGSVVEGGIIESYPSAPYGETIISDGYDQGIIVDEGYSYGCAAGAGCGGGCGGDGCSSGSCGVSGAYFDGECCGRGGCPPGTYFGPSLLGNLSKAIRTGEYFAGAVAFQSPLFTAPGQPLPEDPNQLASDSSFGFYGGFNFGIPLCRLSGGLLSGQFGIRSVSTNFNGNEFSPDDRRQLFVTTGVYRRVDYGLQFGVVADILHEEWFTETDLVQIRADIGWVYPAGHVFGFRVATGVQDEEAGVGVFDGNEFTEFFQTTDDNFRFYYQHAAAWGGFGEGFIGWGESSQTFIGLDLDLPVTNSVAFQSGFTAYLDSEAVPADSNFQGGNLNEGWNVYVGLAIRPSGRRRYKSYDRPLFNVADNGSFVIRRESPELN